MMYSARKNVLDKFKDSKTNFAAIGREIGITHNTSKKVFTGGRVNLDTVIKVSFFYDMKIKDAFYEAGKINKDNKEEFIIAKEALNEEFLKIGCSINQMSLAIKSRHLELKKIIIHKEPCRVFLAVKIARFIGKPLNQLFYTDINKIQIKAKPDFNKEEVNLLGYKLIELSKGVEVSPTMITELLKGGRPISQKVAERIAEFLDLEFDEIFEYEVV